MGHVRYSTAGDTVAANAQPILIECHRGPIALGHNGNLVERGHAAPRAGGGGLHLPVHLRHRGDPPPLRAQPPRAAGGRDRGQPVQGDGRLLAALPHPGRAGGRARPLGLPAAGDRAAGRRATIVCSETCALDLIDAEYVRDVEPGELVVDRPRRAALVPALPARAGAPVRLRARLLRAARQPGLRPQRARRRACCWAASSRARRPADADIVVPVPDSGMGAALGYAQESGLPFEWGLIRNHYVGRTFIEPKQSIRSFGVKIKLNPVRSVLEGKRVVLIDDSIVRGTTSRKIVGMVRDGGRARGAHAHQQPAHHRALLLRHRHAHCKSELIAATHSVEEIRALHRRRQPGLPLPRGPAGGGGRRRGRAPLHRLLLGPLPGGGAQRRRLAARRSSRRREA